MLFASQVQNFGTENIPNSDAEDEEIYDDAGDVLFEAALLRYIPSLTEEEADNFQSYIEANVSKPTFLEDLYRDWPEFGQILEEEMKNLDEDFTAVRKAIDTE